MVVTTTGCRPDRRPSRRSPGSPPRRAAACCRWPRRTPRRRSCRSCRSSRPCRSRRSSRSGRPARAGARRAPGRRSRASRAARPLFASCTSSVPIRSPSRVVLAGQVGEPLLLVARRRCRARRARCPGRCCAGRSTPSSRMPSGPSTTLPSSVVKPSRPACLVTKSPLSWLPAIAKRSSKSSNASSSDSRLNASHDPPVEVSSPASSRNVAPPWSAIARATGSMPMLSCRSLTSSPTVSPVRRLVQLRGEPRRRVDQRAVEARRCAGRCRPRSPPAAGSRW